MNKRRLLKLAGLLEANAKNKKGVRFNLTTWGFVEDEEQPISCGTTACAMGLAAVSGAFARQGLKCRIRYGGIDIGFGRRWDPMIAARRLFEIDDHEASRLFISTGGLCAITGAAGELAVAKRIRDFVAGV